MPDWITGILASVASSGAFTYGLIRLFGNKLLDHQFAKGLERYKFKIDSQFDRISKIHEKEFEVLPRIWALVLKARSILYSLSNPSQEYPNLDVVSQEELEEFLEQSDLKRTDKDKLRASKHRVKDYQLISYIKKLNTANHAIAEMDAYYHANKIFLTTDMNGSIWALRSDFIKAFVTLKNAYGEESMRHDDIMDAYRIIEGHAEKLDQVAAQIQARLRFEEAY